VWFSRVGHHVVKAEYFEAEDERAIAGAILNYNTAYGRVPVDPEDVIVLCDGEYDNTVYEVFENLDDYETSLAKDVVVQWAKEQAAKNAILESVDDVQRGNLSAVLERMEKAVVVGDDLVSPGLDVIADTDQWLYRQWIGKVKTGWPHVDIHLEGGLGEGELGVILAPSNRGKSMALVNIAYGAAGIGSGKNVVIFTHEMSQNVYAKRVAARMLFRFPSRDGDLAVYEYDVKETAKKLMPGKIRVIGGMRMTMHQIEASLERLKAEGFDFDLIIDDYPDLIVPSQRREQKRFELSEIYEWYRGIGNMYGVPTWAASQTNRGGYNKEVITESDIAEDIGKVSISDVIIAVCQTRKEAMDEQCRLFLVKVRDGTRGVMFDAKFYPMQQSIISTGFTRRRKRDNES
jgi:hypothetical protein